MWPFLKRKEVPKFEENSGEVLVQKLNLHLSQTDKIRQMIRHELFRQAIGKPGHETLEEADDFEMDDGDEWRSPYEVNFEPPADQVSPAPVPAPGAAPEPVVSSVTNEPPVQAQ